MASIVSSTASSTARSESVSTAPASWQLWLGRAATVLPLLMLAMSATMKLMHVPSFVETWTTKLGWQEGSLTSIGLLELAIVILVAIPRTAVFGTLLVTGYLGGAIATHVRIGEPFLIPLLLGIFLWAGLYLRDTRLRPLLPLRSH